MDGIGGALGAGLGTVVTAALGATAIKAVGDIADRKKRERLRA